MGGIYHLRELVRKCDVHTACGMLAPARRETMAGERVIEIQCTACLRLCPTYRNTCCCYENRPENGAECHGRGVSKQDTLQFSAYSIMLKRIRKVRSVSIALLCSPVRRKTAGNHSRHFFWILAPTFKFWRHLILTQPHENSIHQRVVSRCAQIHRFNHWGKKMLGSRVHPY